MSAAAFIASYWPGVFDKASDYTASSLSLILMCDLSLPL